MNFLIQIPKINSKEIAWRKMDGDIVAIYLGGSKEEVIEIFNHTGTRIWELCNGKRTVSDIITCLRKEYQEKNSRLKEDVCSFIDTLIESNLLTLS